MKESWGNGWCIHFLTLKAQPVLVYQVSYLRTLHLFLKVRRVIVGRSLINS